MPKTKSGISQMGGKFRLCNTLLQYIPYHEFFLSMFCGACWLELNKPRSRYECYNDLSSEIMNYLVMIERYPEEFDLMKQGVYGLVSQEVCNRIVRGELKPRNNLERAYFFYYLNKLTFGGDANKVGNNEETHAHQCGIMRPTDPIRKLQYEKIKKEWKTKGYHGLIDQKLQNARIDEKVCEEAKNIYKKITLPIFSSGIDGEDDAGNDNNIKKAKASYNGIAIKANQHEMKKWKEETKAAYRGISPKSSFAGINNTRAGNNASNMRDMDKWKREFKETVEESKNKTHAHYSGIGNSRALPGYKSQKDIDKAKKQYQAVSYKGINPKTTRPYHNNDCGLLTPLDPKAIERLRYVNLTCYDFKKVYKLFYNAFHVRKGLSRECFIYADPPYINTEKYFGDKFPKEYHKKLIEIMLNTPFNFMLSIGGPCEEIYIDPLRDADWVIVPVKVRYSTDATSQKLSQEYIIMNYSLNDVGNMKQDNQSSMMRFLK